MDKNELKRISEQIREYLKSGGRIFEYEVTCPIESRIKFMCTAAFPGIEKYKFYLRFLIAKIARCIDFPSVKNILYRLIGVKIGKGAFISPDVTIDPHFPSLIEIGDYAIIGWGATIATHGYNGKKYTIGRVTIGRGAVVGGYCLVHAGVRIGENAEVSSCNNVFRDVKDNSKMRYQRGERIN